MLYNSTQHAREWIATEVERRLFKYVVDQQEPEGGDGDQEAACSKNELWFVPVVNVDGYDYTFVDKGTRLWRKNLRDVNGGGFSQDADGVDTEPQLADELELRPRGRVGRPVERDLPRRRPGLRARGPGDARAREAHRRSSSRSTTTPSPS